MRESRIKYNISASIEELLRKNFEVEKLMSFFKNIKLFEESHEEDEEDGWLLSMSDIKKQCLIVASDFDTG